ncbi:MAG: type II toxin-antitoxin system HicA family toxin [Planctomycetota bacterium]
MSALPRVSGRQVIGALSKIGYEVARRRGSHVRLRHPDDPLRRP